MSIAINHPSTFTTTWFTTNIWSSSVSELYYKWQANLVTSFPWRNQNALPGRFHYWQHHRWVHPNQQLHWIFIAREAPARVGCQRAEKQQCIQTNVERITANMLQSNLNPIAANLLQLSNATVANLQLTLPVLARWSKVVSAWPCPKH